MCVYINIFLYEIKILFKCILIKIVCKKKKYIYKLIKNKNKIKSKNQKKNSND